MLLRESSSGMGRPDYNPVAREGKLIVQAGRATQGFLTQSQAAVTKAVSSAYIPEFPKLLYCSPLVGALAGQTEINRTEAIMATNFRNRVAVLGAALMLGGVLGGCAG